MDSTIWKNKFFPDPLDEIEDILLVLREDVIMLVFQIIGFVMFFLVLTLARAILSRFLGSYSSILDIIYHSINILLIAGFLMKFHDYYLSVQIVTTERIIDVAQTGLFGREVNELSYDKIEDATHKQNGILATMFNFGDVIIQTAASASSKTSGFVFKNIPNPAETHKIIMEARQAEVERNRVYIPVATQTLKQYNTIPDTPPNFNQPSYPPNQINPNQYIPNPLPPSYRENVANTSRDINNSGT